MIRISWYLFLLYFVLQLLLTNMVFENLFAGVANQLLGGYIENIDSKDMSFGLGGIIHVCMSGVVLRIYTSHISAISNLYFPF